MHLEMVKIYIFSSESYRVIGGGVWSVKVCRWRWLAIFNYGWWTRVRV